MKKKVGIILFASLSFIFSCNPRLDAISSAQLTEEKGVEQTFLDYPLDYMDVNDPGFTYRRTNELWPAKGTVTQERSTYFLNYGSFEEVYYFVYMDAVLADASIAEVKKEYNAGPESDPTLYNSFYFDEAVVDGKAIRGYQLKLQREGGQPDLSQLAVYSHSSLEGIPSELSGKKLVMISKKKSVTIKEDLCHKNVLHKTLPFYVRISGKVDEKGTVKVMENKPNTTYNDRSEAFSQTYVGESIESISSSIQSVTALYDPSLIELVNSINRVYLTAEDHEGKEGFSLPIGERKNDGTYVDYFDAATVEKKQGNPFVPYTGYFIGHYDEFKNALISQQDGATDEEGTTIQGFFDKEKVLTIIRSIAN